MQLRKRLNGDNANSVALLMMGELQPLTTACCFMPEELNATISDGP